MSKKEQALKAVEVLTGARSILEKKSAWTKGAFAKDKQDNGIDPMSPDAVKFCSVGACRKASNGCSSTAFSWLSQAFDRCVFDNNDHKDTKHKHILIAFDFAILMAQDELKAVKKAAK